MKNQYYLLGSNNFWYSICDTKKEAEAERAAILKGEGSYDDPETPESVYIIKGVDIEE